MTDDPQAMTAGPRSGVRPPADDVRTAEGRALLSRLGVTPRPYAEQRQRGSWAADIIAIEDAAFAQGVTAARAAVEGLPRRPVLEHPDDTTVYRADVLAAIDRATVDISELIVVEVEGKDGVVHRVWRAALDSTLIGPASAEPGPDRP